MEELSEKEAACPKLLDLIPRDREWVLNREGGQQRSHGCTDEEKLELRLGLPGDEDSCWPTKNNPKIEREEAFLSLRYLSSMTHSNGNNNSFPTPWPCSGYQLHQQNQQHSPKVSFLQYHTSSPAVAKESSQPCSTRMAELQKAEKAFSSAAPPNNTAVPGNSQKRAAPAPVVGWPPIRSFRKNLASNSKSSPEPLSTTPSKIADEKPVENCRKSLFVKINMDGVPIGRKVNLNSFDSYEKLSFSVDELFRGLLAAQRDSSAGKEAKEIRGLLDGSGEYTLVYEDNEGDRMLVGDVPWHMFVSNVKRLRVLKSSDLSSLNRGAAKHNVQNK